MNTINWIIVYELNILVNHGNIKDNYLLKNRVFCGNIKYNYLLKNSFFPLMHNHGHRHITQ